ncbi:hypothetical protein QBZ16_000336 [Prototheca wickerhamii]|uniref:Uncharacterized protein n=1 Tax=Prototheca wickerhamii TaxID=3111 RepID=A0AAD9ILD4_PROWI|nr:hypothetical protein QBZ16_000336 [Prototheca wickerhamii]
MAETRGVGALAGPRVLGRLTPELILRSPQFMNCVGQYELDMRGNRINVIENLGATENQFDSIDLSDNAIARLEGFPKLLRLKVLHLNNNRVNKIGRNLEASLPNLEWLMLTNNRLSTLADLDPLRTLPKLKYLSLLDNPVTKQKGYRLYVISQLPKLKMLDFQKVKESERQAAARLHPAGSKAPASTVATFDPDEELKQVEANLPGPAPQPEAKPSSGPTPEQLTAIKAAIAAASTLEERHISEIQAAAEDAVLALRNECRRQLVKLPKSVRSMTLAKLQETMPDDYSAAGLKQIHEKLASLAAPVLPPATGRVRATTARKRAAVEPPTVLRTAGRPPAPRPAAKPAGAAGSTFNGMPLATPLPFAGPAVELPTTFVTEQKKSRFTRAAAQPSAVVLRAPNGSAYAVSSAEDIEELPGAEAQALVDMLRSQREFLDRLLAKTVTTRRGASRSKA